MERTTSQRVEYLRSSVATTRQLIATYEAQLANCHPREKAILEAALEAAKADLVVFTTKLAAFEAQS